MWRFLTAIALLMPTFSLPSAPTPVTRTSSLLNGTLLYHSLAEVHSFGIWLEPRYIVGAESLDQ